MYCLHSKDDLIAKQKKPADKIFDVYHIYDIISFSLRVNTKQNILFIYLLRSFYNCLLYLYILLFESGAALVLVDFLDDTQMVRNNFD